MKAQHTLAYVSISASADSCKKNSSELCNLKKSEVMRLFLCEARQQIRSIVELCEEFGNRRARAKYIHQNNFYCKIVNDETIFVRSEATNPQHSRAM